MHAASFGTDAPLRCTHFPPGSVKVVDLLVPVRVNEVETSFGWLRAQVFHNEFREHVSLCCRVVRSIVALESPSSVGNQTMTPSTWPSDIWWNQTQPLKNQPTLRLMTAVDDSPDHNRSPETSNQSTEPHRPHQLDDHGNSTLSTGMIPMLTTTATQTLADGIHQPMAKSGLRGRVTTILAYLSRIPSRR